MEDHRTHDVGLNIATKYAEISIKLSHGSRASQQCKEGKPVSVYVYSEEKIVGMPNEADASICAQDLQPPADVQVPQMKAGGWGEATGRSLALSLH